MYTDVHLQVVVVGERDSALSFRRTEGLTGRYVAFLWGGEVTTLKENTFQDNKTLVGTYMDASRRLGEHGEGGHPGDDEKGLSNEDFRRLLETPRVSHVENKKDIYVRNDHMSRILTRDGDTNRKQGADSREEADEGSLYRDRAEERRRGMAEDGIEYEEEPIVKGLDYSLLAKAREERAKAKLDKQEQQQQQQPAPSTVRQHKPKSRSSIAKSIDVVLMQMADKSKSAKERLTNQTSSIPLRQGRISYVYKMDSNDKYEIPTIKMKASTNRESEDQKALTSLSHSLLEEISNIMQYTVRGGSEGTTKPSSRGKVSVEDTLMKNNNSIDQDEEEEDIFGDAGTDYVPEKVVDHKTDNSINKVTSLFEDKNALENAHEGVHVYDVSQEHMITKKKLAKIQEQTDGYDECYPGYFDSGAMLDDSDEDGKALADDEEKEKISKKQGMRREQAKEKAKLEHKLTSIQKIFDEKGYQHDDAFQKKARGKHSRGEPAVLKKKRRI